MQPERVHLCSLTQTTELDRLAGTAVGSSRNSVWAASLWPACSRTRRRVARRPRRRLNPESRLRPGKPHLAPKARSVIFLFMVGGASQLETFDHKPLLNKYAGRLARDIFSKEDLEGLSPEKTYTHTRIVPPVFSFKRYGQSGAWVSEIFPNLTRVVDDIAFINSMHTDSAIHSTAQILMHTGYSRQGHPSLGSWVTYGLGTENRNMPGFVVMKDGRPSGGRALLRCRIPAGYPPGHAGGRQARQSTGAAHHGACVSQPGPAEQAVGSGAEVESPPSRHAPHAARTRRAHRCL